MERLNRSPVKTLHLTGAFLVVGGFLVLLQLAAFNFFLVLYLLAREGQAPGAMGSALFILKHAWPVSLAALLSAAILAPLLRTVRDSRMEKWMGWAYTGWMTLLGTLSTALFFTALVGSPMDTTDLWSATTGARMVSLLSNPVVLSSLLVFLAAGWISFHGIWVHTVGAFCHIFFHVAPLPAPEVKTGKESLSGDEFLDQLKGLVSLAARERRALGIMGLRFANELDLIRDHGRDIYGQAMESLFLATKQIARRGEFQLLYRSNLVISVLFADEPEATQGAGRFQNTLNRILREKHPTWNLTVAVGVGGVRFNGPLNGEGDLHRMVEHLFWAATDQATRAAETGSVTVSYNPAS